MSLALALDLTLIGCLMATVGLGVVLNRRLGALRRDRERLAELAGELAAAIGAADRGVAELRQAAERHGSGLQSLVGRAGAQIEELGFLVERGERIADRLAGAARPGEVERPEPAPSASVVRMRREPVAAAAAAAPATPAGASATAELRRALERLR